MFNFFKNWRKKEGKASYEENGVFLEKLITSSLFTPMKPTDSFKVSLKDRLLDRFSRVSEPSSFFSRIRPVLGTVFAVLAVLVVGSFMYFQKPLFFGPTQVPLVKAGAPNVPVNFSIRVTFPYDVPLEALQKHFSITPETEGTVLFEKGILTFDHPKFLKYDTEYKMVVSKEAAAVMEKDFMLTFHTRKRFASELYLYSRLDIAHVMMNFYEPEPSREIFLPHPGTYTAKVYKTSTDQMMSYTSAAEKNFFEGSENKNDELITALKKEAVDTQTVEVKRRLDRGSSEKLTYKPKLTEAGIYFVEFTGKKQNEYDTGEYRFFITFSRYAVSSKRLGTKLASWLVDTKSATGVSGATVRAYDQNKKLAFEGKTNGEGIHEQDVNLDYEAQPNVLVFETGDETFVQMVKVRYRSIFEGDWQNPDRPHRGFVMFDRPLYSPGDTVQFKAILRKNGEPNYDGSIKTARVEVKQETYGTPTEIVFANDFAVSDSGTFAGEFKLGKELKTGQYTLALKVGGKDTVASYFGVEVFQKPDFEISVKTDKETYLSGDTVKVDVSAKYFFGTPVRNQKVNVDILSSYFYYGDAVKTISGTLDEDGHFTAALNDVRVESPRYYGYWSNDRGIPYTVKVRVTEDTGKSMSKSAAVNFYSSEYRAEIEQPQPLWHLKPRENIPFVLRVKNNFIEGENNVVHDAELQLSLTRRRWNSTEHKSDEWTVVEKTLRTDTFGKAQFDYEFQEGGSYDFKYSVTDAKGNVADYTNYLWIPDADRGVLYDEAQSQSTVQVMLIPDKEKYKVGETAKVNVFLPQSEGQIFLSANTTAMRRIWTEKIEASEKTLEIPVTADLAPGFILFAEVYNGDNFFTGNRLVEVSGKKLSVEITPSKKQLYPKEQVTLEVTTKDENGNPVSSEGAISVVDKAILALRSFTDISLFDSFYPKPNEYMMRRFTSTDAIAVGGAEMGGCFLRGTRILMADGSTKPIEEIVVGDVILTKADEFSSELVKDRVVRTFEHTVGEYLVINGWLKVTPIHRVFVNGKWKTAGEVRIGDWFIDSASRRVAVTSVEKVETLVEVYNFETALYHTYFADGLYVHNDKGGGDTRPRTDFVDTAYWNAFVSTGSDGKGEVSFALPDNLTTWVALGKNITSDTKLGEGEVEFLVTKDLFIRPSLPLFVRSGDEFELLSVIHNNTDKDLNVKALIKATGATVTNETLRELSVSANSVSQVTWKLKIDEVKKLKLEFSVNQIGGDLVDNLERTIPVYPSLTPATTVLTGAAPKNLEFNFDKKGGSSASAKLTLNTSAVSILPSVIEELTGYPYGCVEQTMSKHLPNVLAKKHAKLLGITVPEDIDDKLTEGLDRLAKYQHQDGSFGWWEGDEANIWMTGYVLEGLLEMKELGEFSGRDSMYNATLEYLKNNVASLKAEERIYIAYVLSRALPGENKFKFDEEELSKLQPEFLGYVALTHHFNGNTKEAKRVVSEYILKTLKDHHWEQEGAMRDGHDLSMADKYLATGVNLSALLTIGGAEESEIKGIVQWLMNHRVGYHGLWGSTRQSSQILFALIKYIQKYDEFDPDFEYTVTLNGGELSKGRARDNKFSKEIEIPLNKLSKKNTLDVAYEGKGSLYYTVILKHYVDPAKIEQPENGLKITRAYLKDGKPAQEFSVGDVLTVELAVDSPISLAYAMVEDLLPSGFDVINDRLKSDQDTYYGDSDFGGGFYYWGNPVDIRDERVTIFDSYIGAQRNVFTYRVRVARKGTYNIPAPRVEPMYDPQFYAVGSQDRITVK